jgi:fucose 4-O-acetylase-like acetyltransferase
MSVMAIFTTRERVRLCAGLGIAIAAAAPLVSAIDWRWLPAGLSAYFVPSYQYFAFFPWASFIAFGLSIGSILRLVKPDQMNRVMQWGALAGFGLIVGGQYFSNMPYTVYPKSEFWLDSPWLIVIKLGVVLLVISFAYVWSAVPFGASWSWIRQLGTTSLLVYWVHIELVYGRWFGWLKNNLTNVQCAVAAVIVIGLMVGLSVAQTRWKSMRAALTNQFLVRSPSRASGD